LIKFAVHKPGPNFEKLVREGYWIEVLITAAILSGKRPLSSDNSQFGLAFNTAEVGDVIFILLGCCLPVILRPQSGRFKLVSFAKVLGFMDPGGWGVDRLEEGEYELQDFYHPVIRIAAQILHIAGNSLSF
jgi:hypothetical protein